MKLNEFLVSYGRDHDVSRSYLYQLRYAVDRFSAWLGRCPTVADLTRDSINSWLQYEQLAGALGPRTRRNIRTSILTLWTALYDERLASSPERIRPVKVPERCPEAWSFDQLRRIASAAAELPGEMTNGVPRSWYFPTLIWFCFETGLRRSDALRFDLAQLKDDRGGFTQQKSGRAHAYALTRETVADVLRIASKLKQAGDPNWKNPLRFPGELGMLYYWFRRIRSIARVDVDIRNRSLQHLRRTGATQVEIESPGAAPEYLGHGSGPELARKHYIDRRLIGRTVSPARNRTCPRARRSKQ